MWTPVLQLIILLAQVSDVSAACQSAELDFIVQSGDAVLAAIEDDVRADLAELGVTVNTRLLSKEDFNSNMTSGNFNLCFSETWGPPYDPHSYAASWKSPRRSALCCPSGNAASYDARSAVDKDL